MASLACHHSAEHVLPYKNAADFRRIANGLAKAGLTRPELRLPPSQLERE
jgi:hypothetical protein